MKLSAEAKYYALATFYERQRDDRKCMEKFKKFGLHEAEAIYEKRIKYGDEVIAFLESELEQG